MGNHPGLPGRKGVTLLLLWEEYLRERLDGYSYGQFCKRFQEWCQSNKLSMRRHYRAGEVMFVDYAGMKVGIYDRGTGELPGIRSFPVGHYVGFR